MPELTPSSSNSRFVLRRGARTVLSISSNAVEDSTGWVRPGCGCDMTILRGDERRTRLGALAADRLCLLLLSETINTDLTLERF